MQKGYLHQAMNSHLLWAKTAANASVARTAANVQLQKQDRRQSIAEVIFTPSWPRTQQLHSKNEGMKHIPAQNDSHTFSFHTIGMKEAFILL